MKVRNQKSEVRSRITAIGKRLDEQSTSGLRLGYEKAIHSLLYHVNRNSPDLLRSGESTELGQSGSQRIGDR